MIDKLRPLYKDAKEKAADKNANGGDKKYGVGVSLINLWLRP